MLVGLSTESIIRLLLSNARLNNRKLQLFFSLQYTQNGGEIGFDREVE